MDFYFLEGADEVVPAPFWLEGRTWHEEALEQESRSLPKLFSKVPSCFMLFS